MTSVLSHVYVEDTTPSQHCSSVSVRQASCLNTTIVTDSIQITATNNKTFQVHI